MSDETSPDQTDPDKTYGAPFLCTGTSARANPNRLDLNRRSNR
jgi:hypothetical protein